MKILFLYQYFGTPKGSWSTRVYELCRRWVEQGHDVEVITAPYEKSDIKPKGLISIQEVDGIRLSVINSGDNNRLSVLKRGVRALFFSIISSFIVLSRKYDVIIASSGPITIGFPMILAKLIRRKKCVFEVRDLWPSGGVELGLIRSRIFIKLAFWLEKLCYQSADLVVVSSIGQQQHILQRFEKLNTLVIPNASDITLFGNPSKETLPSEFADFVLLTHIGSLGKIHNISYWLDIAEEFQNRKWDIVKFIFIGDGADRTELENKAIVKQLYNIHFLGLMPKVNLPVWVQNSYATLFATTDNPVQDTCSPNKIFDSFAAGIPIIQTSKGWIKEMVEQENCGLNIHLKDVSASVDQIIFYIQNPELRNTHAKNAAQLAKSEFDRDQLSEKYLNALTKL